MHGPTALELRSSVHALLSHSLGWVAYYFSKVIIDDSYYRTFVLPKLDSNKKTQSIQRKTTIKTAKLSSLY